MSERAIVENDSEPKANMDAIYVQPDPRAYFRELAKVDYTIPDLAKPIFRRLVEALSERRAIPLQALDLGCSYGVNAALLKHDLSMEDAVGYITEQTFGKLLPAITRDSTPWIANFVLRMFPFDAIAETLAQWGYVTEKLEGRTFVQRSFVSDGEQARVIAALEKLGIDAAGLESEGQLHAEFFLSRPRDEAEALPLERLLAD